MDSLKNFPWTYMEPSQSYVMGSCFEWLRIPFTPVTSYSSTARPLIKGLKPHQICCLGTRHRYQVQTLKDNPQMERFLSE